MDPGLPFLGSTPLCRQGGQQRRMERHDTRQSHGTMHGTGWVVIHSEEYSTRSAAYRRERWLKTGKGREWLEASVAGGVRRGEAARRAHYPEVIHSPLPVRVRPPGAGARRFAADAASRAWSIP